MLAALAIEPAPGAGETTSPAPSSASPSAFTRASDVSRLPASEAIRSLPVRLSGTVVYSDPGWSVLFIVDDSGTVFVDPLDLAVVPPTGAVVEIEGETGVMGAFPGVAPTRLRETGRLLVDDETILRTVIGEMLENLGYRVTRCADGREAVAQLTRDPAGLDLLLSDLTMPDMTGDVLTLEALAVRADLPVLLATGYGAQWTVEQARALGAHDLLLKPIPFEDLARAVRAAIDGRPARG